MLKLPDHIDQNEYFIIVVIIALLFLCFYLPKVVPRSVAMANGLFFIFSGIIADKILGVKYPFDFYDTMDSSKLNLCDELLYLIIYPLYGYLHIYFVWRFKLREKPVLLAVLFIITWAFLSSSFEFISVQFDVFNYKNGWNVLFSFLAYIFVFTITQCFSRMTIILHHSEH